MSIAQQIGVGVVPTCPRCFESVDTLEVKHGVTGTVKGERVWIDGSRLETMDLPDGVEELADWPGGATRTVAPCGHRLTEDQLSGILKMLERV